MTGIEGKWAVSGLMRTIVTITDLFVDLCSSTLLLFSNRIKDGTHLPEEASRTCYQPVLSLRRFSMEKGNNLLYYNCLHHSRVQNTKQWKRQSAGLYLSSRKTTLTRTESLLPLVVSFPSPEMFVWEPGFAHIIPCSSDLATKSLRALGRIVPIFWSARED